MSIYPYFASMFSPKPLTIFTNSVSPSHLNSCSSCAQNIYNTCILIKRQCRFVAYCNSKSITEAKAETTDLFVTQASLTNYFLFCSTKEMKIEEI